MKVSRMFVMGLVAVSAVAAPVLADDEDDLRVGPIVPAGAVVTGWHVTTNGTFEPNDPIWGANGLYELPRHVVYGARPAGHSLHAAAPVATVEEHLVSREPVTTDLTPVQEEVIETVRTEAPAAPLAAPIVTENETSITPVVSELDREVPAGGENEIPTSRDLEHSGFATETEAAIGLTRDVAIEAGLE